MPGNDTFHMFKLAERLSVDQLIRAIQSGSIDPNIGQLVLNNKVKERQRLEGAQAQAQPQQPPIAQENMMAAMRQPPPPPEWAQQAPPPPLAQQAPAPFGMAHGGIVGFQKGGFIKGDTAEDIYWRNILRNQYGAEPQVSYKLYEPFSAGEPAYPQTKENVAAMQTDYLMRNLPKLTAEQLKQVHEYGPGALNFGRPTIKAAAPFGPTTKGAPYFGSDPIEPMYNLPKGSLIPQGPFADLPPSEVPAPAEAPGISGVPGGVPGMPSAGLAALQALAARGGGGGGGGGGGNIRLKGYENIYKALGEDKEAKYGDVRDRYKAELEAGDKETFDAIRQSIEGQKGQISKADEQNMWLSLMKAGLATAAGRSQYALTNIAEGGEAGLSQYTQRDILNRELERKLAERDEALRLEENATRKGNIKDAAQFAHQREIADRDAHRLEAELISSENRDIMTQAEMAQRERIAGMQEGGANQRALAQALMGMDKFQQEMQLEREKLQVTKDYNLAKTAAEKAEAEARKLVLEKQLEKIKDVEAKGGGAGGGGYMSIIKTKLEQTARALDAKYGPNWMSSNDKQSLTAQREFMATKNFLEQNLANSMNGGLGALAGNEGTIRDLSEL